MSPATARPRSRRTRCARSRTCGTSSTSTTTCAPSRCSSTASWNRRPVSRGPTACRAHGAPLLSRGGGTGLAGQTTNVAVVIDFSKYLNRIVEIDAEQRVARVEPGLILDHLRKQAEEEHQLTFGPDPSTHEYCTFGGMIASNSCGVRSVMAQFYGPGPRTSDNVEELDVLLYDGRRLRVREGTSGDDEIDRRLGELRDRYAERIRARYPDIPRRVSG